MDARTHQALKEAKLREEMKVYVEQEKAKIQQWFYENKITSKYAQGQIAKCAMDIIANIPNVTLNAALEVAAQQFFEDSKDALDSLNVVPGFEIVPNQMVKDNEMYLIPRQGISREDLKLMYEGPKRSKKKCGCGAESIGCNTHSQWCEKFEA